MQTTICVRAKKATDSRQAAYPGEAERGKYVASQIHETEGLFDWSDSSIAWAAITWLSDFSHVVDSILASDQTTLKSGAFSNCLTNGWPKSPSSRGISDIF